MNPIDTGYTKLSDLYPDIERLTLFVAFEEAEDGAEPNYQQIIFTGHSVADFRLDCSREECVDGGFDYEPFIDELVRSQEQRAQGKILCQGSLGRGEESSCCALKSEYRLIVQRRP